MYPRVNVLILNWNGENIIEDCVQSVLQSKYENLIVTVIDNGSIDKSIDSLVDKKYNINFIRIKKNLGFAKGYNFAFEKIKNDNNDFFLILNNEKIINENTISKFVEKSNEYGHGHIFGPKIINANDKLNWFCGGKINKITGQPYHLGINTTERYVSFKSSAVEYISGCCMFLSSKTLYSLGGFNPKYKMYYEDVDFCLRAKKKGIHSFYFSDISIDHLVSYSIGGRFSSVKLFIKIFSFIKFLYFNHSLFLFLFYFITNIFVFPFSLLIFLFRKLK